MALGMARHGAVHRRTHNDRNRDPAYRRWSYLANSAYGTRPACLPLCKPELARLGLLCSCEAQWCTPDLLVDQAASDRSSIYLQDDGPMESELHAIVGYLDNR